MGSHYGGQARHHRVRYTARGADQRAGIRFTPPNNALTTIPALANVGTGGGSIAHLASGGDGWQPRSYWLIPEPLSTTVYLRFFADQTGLPLTLPLSYPLSGDPNVYPDSSIARTLASG